jgi:hypothetical protein
VYTERERERERSRREKERERERFFVCLVSIPDIQIKLFFHGSPSLPYQ